MMDGESNNNEGRNNLEPVLLIKSYTVGMIKMWKEAG